MRTHLAAGILLVATLPTPALLPAQDNPQAVLEKAIVAHGGERLLKAKTLIRTAKGLIESFPMAVPFTGEAHLNLPEQGRWTFDMDRNGQKLLVALVLNKDKGWRASGGAAKDLTKQELEDLRDEAHAAWLTTLLPIVQQRLDIAPLPDSKVAGESVAGIKVASKGRPDVRLYFDRRSGLLVKAEYKGKEGDLDVVKEYLYSGYKDHEGVKLPMKVLVQSNGKRVAEWTVTTYKLVDKLDDTALIKP